MGAVSRATAEPGPPLERGLLAARWPELAVAALTLLGLILRLTGLHESLFGDELYLYEIARLPSLGDVLSRVHGTESTPPLGFVLAWAAAKLGDPTVTVRLPSLVLGTAAIPLTYLLGARTVGRLPALAGAGFLAISPFAIWYADEARAYSTMIFLALLSALALLRALDTRRTAWWIAYAVSACLVLYTHYMGVFVVVALAGWSFWTRRDRLRELLAAHAAIAIGFLPWVPSFVVQSDDTSAQRISTFKQFTPKGVLRELTIAVDGHPFLPLSSVPGRVAVILLAIGAAAAAAGAVAGIRRARPRLGSGTALVVLLALATPAGVALYSVVGMNTYIPRNLSASLPPLLLALGAGIAALRRPWALLAGACVVAALAIGALRVVDPDRGRPPYRQAAEFVDAHDGGGGVVVEYPLFPAFANTDEALGRHLEVHFGRAHELRQVRSPASPGWDGLGRYRRVFVVTPWDAAHRAGGPPLPARYSKRFRLVARGTWRGLVPVAAFEYAARD
jgi:mannosyltransferase